MPKTFLIRKRSCSRTLWPPENSDDESNFENLCHGNDCHSPAGNVQPIPLALIKHSAQDRVKQVEPSRDSQNRQTEPENAVTYAKTTPRNHATASSLPYLRKISGENQLSEQKSTETNITDVANISGLINLERSDKTEIRDVLPSGQNGSVETQKLNGVVKPGWVEHLKTPERTGRHNPSRMANAMSPFLPQISPSMPTGSRSFISKHNTEKKCINTYYERMKLEDMELFRPSGCDSVLETEISSSTMLPRATKSDVKIINSGIDFGDNLTSNRDVQWPPKTHAFQNQMPAPNRTVELINGGYGIKNPLLSPDLHTRSSLSEELPGDYEAGKISCRICGENFEIPKQLQRHLKGHNDVKRYLCTFCGKGFNDTFDLKRHTRTHTGVRPYRCSSCDKAFTQRCSLESHCRKIHGVEYNFAYKERREKVYVCEECGHVTYEPEEHFMHIKEKHPLSSILLRCYDKRQFKFGEDKDVISV